MNDECMLDHFGSFWIILALEFIPETGLEHLIATCTNRIMDNLAGKTVIKNQESRRHQQSDSSQGSRLTK